jgi:gluconate 5-dehydrogenase
MADTLFDLTGHTAVVTGASRGLGQYMARALARAGADVVITSRDKSRLAETQRDIEAMGRRAWSVELDVLDKGSIDRFADWVGKKGKVEILVNNAGCNVRKPAVDVTWEDWELIVNTNLRGPFFIAQAMARLMIPRRYGRIINIGSVTCVAGYANLAPYCASRGGIKQMTMSLADDWGPHGITVNCLAPGWFKTGQTAPLYANEAWVEYLCDKIPLKRPGEPHDLDGAVVFLASPASQYLTGQTLLVDGGISIGSTKTTMKK